MPEYNNFFENVYSDELIQADPDEFDEVQRLMAEEGYHEFSINLSNSLTSKRLG